jgi:hypothetical protein
MLFDSKTFVNFPTDYEENFDDWKNYENDELHFFPFSLIKPPTIEIEIMKIWSFSP